MDFILPDALKDELTIFPSASLEQITTFCVLLDQWNKKINLTGSKSALEIAQDHVLDSIKAAKLLPTVEAFIDIGTGAGFPGLVLAMLWPDREAHLVEPREKSATFLKEAIKALGIKNVSVYIRAIEDLQGEEIIPIYQEFFSISRAFSPIKKFIGYCHYLIREESPLFLMTGENSEVLDPSILQKHNIRIVNSTGYDQNKPKKLLVELRSE